MKLNSEIKLHVKSILEKRLNSNKEVSIINGSKKQKEFIPYTMTRDENLYCSVDDKILNFYSNRDLDENFKALTSSSVLTYNTFCNISVDNRLKFDGNEYYEFVPEKPRKIINQRGAISKIDAELISREKTLLIESKMFEPYDRDIKSGLAHIDSYLMKEKYSEELFTHKEIENWIRLFTDFADDVKSRIITQFDILQFLKHLLSIVSNKTSFKTDKVELLSLIWHASYSFVGFWTYADEVREYDGKTLQQTEYCIDKINDFLKDNNYDWVSVSSYDYSEFVWSTNIFDNQQHFKYLSRYFDTVDISTKLIFEIEMDAMCTTIYKATDSHFVKNYCSIMREQVFPKDIDSITLLLPRLLGWYDEGYLKKLLIEPYTVYKREHLYTYLLLNTLIKELHVTYVRPRKTVKVPPMTTNIY